MKKNLIWVPIIFMSICMAYLVGTVVYDRHHNAPSPMMRYSTDVMHPDTVLSYWDRGNLYLIFTTYHEDTVSEDNQ